MIQFERLAMLEARVGRGDEAYRGGFYFGDFYEERSCGTAACAAGWCPAIWPEHWTREGCVPILIERDPASAPIQDLMKWFGLDEVQTYHLFIPMKQLPEVLGGDHLTCDCTAEEWADNCRAFRLAMGDPALQPVSTEVPSLPEDSPSLEPATT